MSINKTSLFDKAVESVEKCVSGTVNHLSNSSKCITKEARESFVGLGLVSNRTAIIFGDESLLNEFASMGLPARLYTVDSFIKEGFSECAEYGFDNIYLHKSIGGDLIKVIKSKLENNTNTILEGKIGHISSIKGKSGDAMLKCIWDDMSSRYRTK